MPPSSGELRPGVVVRGTVFPEPIGRPVAHPMGAGETTDDVAKSNLTAVLQQHGLENVRSL